MSDYCSRCNKWFRNIQAHFDNSRAHDFRCDDCDEDFDCSEDLEDHDIDEHGYCYECQEFYRDRENLVEHDVEAHGYCIDCDRFFGNNKQHWRDSPRHAYCFDCDRHFQNQNNLNAHLKSRIHQPQITQCPGCGNGFGSVSGLTLHLESGTCFSGVNNSYIKHRMRELDYQNIITQPGRMITSGRYSFDETPDIWATEASYNPYIASYECPFPRCGRTFNALSSVNQHLESLIHEQKEYRCPSDGCGGFRFSRLSALVQHIESNKCGVGQWRQVKTVMGAIQSRRLLMG